MPDAELETWLQGGDAAIRAQVRRDLLGGSGAEAAADRAAASDEGAAAELLALQRPDGQWGVGVYDGDDWCSTTDALWILRELDVDPADDRVRAAVDLVAEHVRWEERNGGRPFFEGETEACVNGRVLALGAHFGRTSGALTDRLLGEQLEDGGWNCEAPASTRSSFHPTACVLEGLLGVLGAADDSRVMEAVDRGLEYLLERRLLRSRSTGELLDADWLTVHVPTYWCYDVLRGLELLRVAGRLSDPRAEDALEALRSSRSSDGTWSATPHPGWQLVRLEPDAPDTGAPSRWATLRALRVLAAAGLSA